MKETDEEEKKNQEEADEHEKACVVPSEAPSSWRRLRSWPRRLRKYLLRPPTLRITVSRRRGLSEDAFHQIDAAPTSSNARLLLPSSSSSQLDLSPGSAAAAAATSSLSSSSRSSRTHTSCICLSYSQDREEESSSSSRSIRPVVPTPTPALELPQLLVPSGSLVMSSSSSSSAQPVSNCGSLEQPGSVLLTQIDYVNYFIPNMREIMNCPYYWGKIDRYQVISQIPILLNMWVIDT